MRFLMMLVIAFALAACERQAPNENAAEGEEATVQEPARDEQLTDNEADAKPLPPTSVDVNEKALDEAVVLSSQTGPEGTQLEIVRAEANTQQMVVQMRVVNPTDKTASFRLDPRSVLAQTRDKSLMAPSVGGAANSEESLSREELQIEVEPEESEIVSLAFFAPETDVQQIELHLPGMQPMTELPLTWEQQKTAQEDGEEEKEEADESKTG